MQSHYITASRHCITPSHYTTALRHRITSLHYTIALRHCITPLRHNTRSTRSTAYTLGRHCKPISSHNRAARHSRATLCHFFVAGESALIPSRISSETPSAPLGDITSLYRPTTEPRDTLGRRYSPKVFPNSAMRHSRATLLPLKRSPTVLRGTLGQHYKPISFPNSSARHPWATLQAYIVPQQGRATLSGDITAPKRSPTVLRGTLGQRFATFSSLESSH